VLLAEASMVALRRRDGAVVAVGDAAREMAGRAPGTIEVIRPLRGGVIAELGPAVALLRHLLGTATRRPRLAQPRVVVCVPGDVTDTERRAVVDAAMEAGARSVAIVDEPTAAAIGAGLPIAEAQASMILDVGGGTTEVAVLALGGIVTRTSVRVAGDDLDAAITTHLICAHRLLVGERSAEALKRAAASAHPAADGPAATVCGRNLDTGLPARALVTAAALRSAIDEPVERICAAVQATLARTPAELVADMLDRGLVITGGGALLRGLDRRLAEATGMPVTVAPIPLRSVALGAARYLEHLELLDELTAAP
jgi:rod shape-determining protein MreB and related proteins